ncbi:MAG: adenylate/guanylate cyclase domain-containing protein [Acidiferrobacterales bacterium]
MTRRYYLSMLSPAVLGLVVVLLAAAVAPDLRLQHVPYAVLSLALIMVPLILLGAHFIFSPIARYLNGREDFGQAQRRIRRLALLSAVWTFILSLVWGQPMFYFWSIFCDGCGGNSFPVPILHPLLLTAIYAAFLAGYIYFLINDYVLRLKEQLFRQSGVVIEPSRGRILYKLVIAFAVTSVVPLSLVFLETFVFTDLRQIQGLDTMQALELDVIAAVVLVGVAIVFIKRSLTRPVESLLTAVRQVGHGDLEAKVPVLSDDEIGRLTVGFNAMAEGLGERAFIRETLGKFVSESIATAVLQDRGVVRPQVREATILFTDIERFTAISERLQPEQVIAMLNEYFAVAAQPVHDNGGVITQFQGDAILASFNLPMEDADHAANAVRAASAIQRLLEHQRFANGIALNTRIGINTGLVVGGTVGDGDRLGYTVHGDTVNLAARLEQLNKEYGSRVLLSQRTAELADDSFEFKKIGEVAIRGRETPITVYELPRP